MKRKILGTFISRILVAFSSLLVLILTSRVLGPEVRGTISLILIAMTITVLINEIVAGPALVYFFPRTQHKRLFLYAFSWILLCSALVPFLLSLGGLLPSDLLPWIIIIIMFQATSGISMMYQLGTESTFRYNLLAVMQAIINPTVLFLLVYHYDVRSIHSWLLSVGIAQGLTAITGIILIFKSEIKQKGELDPSIKQLAGFGFLAQLSTLAYILSTRIPYYYLDSLQNRAKVGIFSTAVSFTEAALLFSSSVAVMTYSRIANSDDESYNLRITTILSKVTFLITLPFMCVLILIPDEVYQLILGEGFIGIRENIVYLFPGVCVISMSTIFTHYFSGKGMYKVNVYASLAGLSLSSVLAVILIPHFGITGAAITTSFGYIGSGVFTIFYFRKKNSGLAGRLLPGVSDVKTLVKEAIRKSR